MKRITFRCDGIPLTAEYAPHELEFMSLLRAGLDGPHALWNRDTMLIIHELKAYFPGSELEYIPADDYLLAAV